jgi:hypothetical protein
MLGFPERKPQSSTDDKESVLLPRLPHASNPSSACIHNTFFPSLALANSTDPFAAFANYDKSDDSDDNDDGDKADTKIEETKSEQKDDMLAIINKMNETSDIDPYMFMNQITSTQIVGVNDDDILNPLRINKQFKKKTVDIDPDKFLNKFESPQIVGVRDDDDGINKKEVDEKKDYSKPSREEKKSLNIFVKSDTVEIDPVEFINITETTCIVGVEDDKDDKTNVTDIQANQDNDEFKHLELFKEKNIVDVDPDQFMNVHRTVLMVGVRDDDDDGKHADTIHISKDNADEAKSDQREPESLNTFDSDANKSTDEYTAVADVAARDDETTVKSGSEKEEQVNYMIEIEAIKGNSPEIINKKMEAAIKYLCILKAPKSILKSELANKCLRCIFRVYLIGGTHRKTLYKYVMEKSCESILLGIVDYVYENQFSHLMALIEANSSYKVTDKELSSPIELVKSILIIFLTGTNYLKKFAMSIIEKNAIGILLKFVTNETTIQIVQTETKLTSKYISGKFIRRLARNVFGCLHNMSHSIEKTRSYWVEQDSTRVLMELSEKLESIDSFRNVLYLTISNIAKDGELNLLPKISSVLKDLAHIVKKFDETYKRSKITRFNVQLDENEEDFKIISVDVAGIKWHLTEVLGAFCRLAINDKLKSEIYFDNNMRDYTRTIISHGNDIEAQFGLKLLWQLCFDERIAKDVREDTDFVLQIETIKFSSTSARVIENSKGLLWQIKLKPSYQEELEQSVTVDSLNKVEDEINISLEREQQFDDCFLENDDRFGSTIQKKVIIENDDKHVMISYNKESRDLCLKIKSELEASGYRVWMDVSHIHGSAIDAMANAIEDSFCVLMCMTEKYKSSENCRAEAEFAWQRRKPIIPLYMQAGYEADGW